MSTTEAVHENSTVQAQVNSDTQAGQTESEGQSETFFDPKQVPEELVPAYKQMQAAFTKKTQEIATTRKEAEGLKAKADAYVKYEKYVPILEEMFKTDQKGSTAESPEMTTLENQLRKAGYSDEAIEMMKMGAQFTLQQMNRFREADRQQFESQRRMTELSEKVDEAQALDPRLSDDTLTYQMDDQKLTFGEIVANLVKADEKWQSDPIAATRRAIKIVDSLIGTAKLQGKEELSAAAKAKASKFPSATSSPQSAVTSSKALSMSEAAEQAKAQLGIK